ncbi:MAG: preprotein translocase subunit YajC [Alphaproteobacteria bacterium]
MMGISQAIAQTAEATAPVAGPVAATATSDPMSAVISLLPIVMIFFVFYVLVLRPQQKAVRTHQKTLDLLRRGDKVVTAGGLLATVVRIQDDEVTLEIAEGVKVKAVKSTIARVTAKIGGDSAATSNDDEKNGDSTKANHKGK